MGDPTSYSEILWSGDPATRRLLWTCFGLVVGLALTVFVPLILRSVRLLLLERRLRDTLDEYESKGAVAQRGVMREWLRDSVIQRQFAEFERRWTAAQISEGGGRAPIRLLDVFEDQPLLPIGPRRSLLAVLPGVLLGLAGHREVTDEALVRALATAGLIGAVVAVRASLSGAEGGCQAETGAAAGMAAGAGVELLGGTPEEAVHAVALTMQGTLGLVCDPLGGLVEVPCVYRNATGAAMALAGIEMALAGVRFPIPVDEVIDTMGEIGRSMDVRYRETAGGGLAATPTGRKLARERLVQIKGKPKN